MLYCLPHHHHHPLLTLTPQSPPTMSPPHLHLTALIILATLLLPISALNITAILSHYPDLSDFTTLLTTTGISSDINLRISLTILAVPNTLLRSTAPLSPTTLPDTLRYHTLLQLLTLPDLRRAPPPGTLITTLLSTTNHPSPTSLNLTYNPSSGLASFHPPNNYSETITVVNLVATVQNTVSIFSVDGFLTPVGFDIAASEAPSRGVNITKALIDGHDFNVAASMLVASGVVAEFEEDEGGAGITLFVPTDTAFANLPPAVELQALAAGEKALVLKFHVLHSYYPLGSLEAIVNPVQPTLATEDNGAGSFTLNISRVNGSVEINTGVVQGVVVTSTVFDQNPVAIFGVSSVLLPREIFGQGVDLRGGSSSGPFVAAAQPPDVGPAPESLQDDGGATHLSSPPGIASQCGRGIGGRMVWLCIGVLYVLLV